MSNPFTKGKVASRTGNAALTEEIVRQIRRLAKEHSTRDLAEAYGVGMETIRKIVRRDSWKWLPDEIDFDKPLGAPTEAERVAAEESAKRVMAAAAAKPAELTGLAKLQALARAEQERLEEAERILREIGKA